jgi:SAM-dependent methyltransferase
MLVPAATLKVLLDRSGRLEVVYTGFPLAPSIRDGDRLIVETSLEPRRGDLALCQVGPWGDIRRILTTDRASTLLTGLDACPRGRDILSSDQVLGLVKSPGGPSRVVARHLVALLFPLWSRWAALLYWWRRILEVPDFGAAAADSVRQKYDLQIRGYADLASQVAEGEPLTPARRYVRAGGSILIAGCGTGGEALGLARAGYRVCGFDFVPAMVQAGRRHARQSGFDIEFLEADMTTLDLKDRRFDGIYVTPLVYAFISGGTRRVESLRRLGRHLAPGGVIVLSAFLFKRPVQWIEASLVWARGRIRGIAGREFGDWYTWYLTPRGTIGKSFLHVSTASQVIREIHAAGFRRTAREGKAHFVAGEFQPGTGESMAGQKSTSWRK